MFPQRLKKARIEKKLTQEELAKRVNTKKTTISNYETGYSTPSQEMLSDLADVLGKSTDYLLGRSEIINESRAGYKPDGNLSVADEIFFDGFLNASDEEKEKLRRYWYDNMKKMKENSPDEEYGEESAWDIVRNKKK